MPPERTFTLSVAQIQTLALKTMGFKEDHEVIVRAPYIDSTEIEFDIFHVRVGIDHDGHWHVCSRVDGLTLGEGSMPRLGVRRPDGEPYPL